MYNRVSDWVPSRFVITGAPASNSTGETEAESSGGGLLLESEADGHGGKAEPRSGEAAQSRGRTSQRVRRD